MQLMETRWFFHFLQGIYTQFVWLDPEFQFTATTTMSMGANSSNLEDQMSGTNVPDGGPCGHAIPKSKGPWRDGSVV